MNNPGYHWFKALGIADPDERERRLRSAVACEPGLAEPWLLLARAESSRGEILQAWRTMLAGLDYNRSFRDDDQTGARMHRFTRQLWVLLSLDGETRRAARQLLNERFGDESPAWEQRLGLATGPARANEEVFAAGPFARQPPSTDPPTTQWSLERAIDLDATLGTSDPTQPRDLSAPPVQPDDPQSAVLGRRL